MFSEFPQTLRRYGIDADVRLIMDMYRTMEMGIVTNLGSLFDVCQYLICKSRREIAPYTLAFWEYFLGIDAANYNTIDDAVLNSAAFEHWLSDKIETGKISGEVDYKILIDQFLNDTLNSDLQANIQKELDARKHLDQDNPDLKDKDRIIPTSLTNSSNTMVDYSKVSLNELMERMKRVMDNQKISHSGGGHWIGSHGYSPYGHSGSGLNGIRISGSSHARSARKVLGESSFYPIELDALIK
jgi:Uncharacterized protein conserved in bacteria